MLDHSGSVGRSNWRLLIDFIVSFVDSINVGEGATRVGAVSFGTQRNSETNGHFIQSRLSRGVHSPDSHDATFPSPFPQWRT